MIRPRPRFAPLAIAAALASAVPLAAKDDPPSAPSPNEIVAMAEPSEWVAIAPADLLLMTLSPDAKGKPRKVVIQLMPPPFSQGWVDNIRKLAAAHWYDGLAITRVQDNYVVQWGDPDGEDRAKAKALPGGIATVPASQYALASGDPAFARARDALLERARTRAEITARNMAGQNSANEATRADKPTVFVSQPIPGMVVVQKDPYADGASFQAGWPVGFSREAMWPVHCYGMVGVGRDYSPDTGSGAELYTVIGHAPRHLDRNIALVGRVVEGIEHLSSLPRGTDDLGFYETPEERTPIVSIRLASELPGAQQPQFQYLSTESEAFARYADARANRRDPFFIVPAGGADICNIPVPVRRVGN